MVPFGGEHEDDVAEEEGTDGFEADFCKRGEGEGVTLRGRRRKGWTRRPTRLTSLIDLEAGRLLIDYQNLVPKSIGRIKPANKRSTNRGSKHFGDNVEQALGPCHCADGKQGECDSWVEHPARVAIKGIDVDGEAKTKAPGDELDGVCVHDDSGWVEPRGRQVFGVAETQSRVGAPDSDKYKKPCAYKAGMGEKTWEGNWNRVIRKGLRPWRENSLALCPESAKKPTLRMPE